jgi:hypothetical protein
VVQTVHGPVSPDALGVTFTSTAPVIDWSALYEQPMAPAQGAFRQTVIEQSVKGLAHFHGPLGSWAKTGTPVIGQDADREPEEGAGLLTPTPRAAGGRPR